MEPLCIYCIHKNSPKKPQNNKKKQFPQSWEAKGIFKKSCPEDMNKKALHN